MKHRVVMVAVGAAIGVEAARAGTPFGGDDTGFVPPDKETLKCESSVTKNAAKLTLAVSICDIKAADAGVKARRSTRKRVRSPPAGNTTTRTPSSSVRAASIPSRSATTWRPSLNRRAGRFSTEEN